jgi:hypothetical protein
MRGSQTIVEALNEKLCKKTGTAVASMRLELRDETGTMVADLESLTVILTAYSPYDGCVRPPHSHLPLLHTAPDLKVPVVFSMPRR